MTILLIEDDKTFADLITLAFPNDNIVVAASLAIAHTLMKISRPVLMLVDLALPDSEGTDILLALKPYRCPKIALTSNQTGISIDAAKLGTIDYIRKTNATAEVLARVSFNIDKYRPKQRFAPETFKQIQACIQNDRLVSV